MSYKIEGEYTITSQSTITNTKTNITLHLRKRKKPSKTKPDYFLSINKPAYEYISSIYLSPTKRQLQKLNQTVSFDNLSTNNQPDVVLYFDYQNQDYKLEKIKEKARIEQF